MQTGAVSLFLLLGCVACSSGGADRQKSQASRCIGQPCNPSVGNLAVGRSVQTLTTCGEHATELYCSFLNSEGPRDLGSSCRHTACSKCNSKQPGYSHQASDMTGNSFRQRDSWWQSAQGVPREEIRLDLETEFYLTHVILVFKSPRPAAMILEHSQDFGHSWRPYKYFARNCTETFGMVDDSELQSSLCTSRYSDPLPCSNGEVIFRALSPANRIENPYSPEAQDLLKLTNLRLHLLKQQECPCQPGTLIEKSQRFAHYAVYDLIVQGSCFCNGHAEECRPSDETKQRGRNTDIVVHGKCVCRHNTAGDHCERCAPLYNDQPWQPGDGKTGAPNQCAKCQCHGHARSCRFNQRVWLASSKQSGGICLSCQHHTEGRHCQRCMPGYYRDREKPLSAPDACKPCSCHPVGSTNSSFHRSWKCDAKSGYCYCRPGVGGPQCTHCLVGYWGFGESGCKPCECARACDPQTGQCLDSFENEQIHNIPIGGRIPDLIDFLSSESTGDQSWEDEQGFSALRHSEKCICKEVLLRDAAYFCRMNYTYVIKARVLSAHDKGTHAEVNVKVKKVMKTGKVKITRGNWSIYPESWTKRGCTCPLLNPGTDYLIAGHEAGHVGRLLVNMKSLVTPWRAGMAKWVTHNLQWSCK
ncbi:netrin-4 isoform X1 [Stegostoma tigrinum]|uniref:netrin-4 isoform X1 n=1 Tax=Stegostoma tigrinum TaxID=3053191 RepID=UPI00286FCB6E|nr:netrin-4 isoform X1 [Stegostoma tigrinum]